MNNKFSSILPLIDKEKTINDSQEKSNLFNHFFASKTNINGFDDQVPALDELHIASKIQDFNTSPFEIAKIIRELKNSIFHNVVSKENFYH